MPDNNDPDTAREHLVEIWGDLVDVAHLRGAVLIGVATSLPAFLLSSWLFSTIVDTPALADTYALLVGLAACLVAGAICSRRYPPKRTVQEETADAETQRAIVGELAAAPGGLGHIEDLPAATRHEMRSLGIYDLFTADQQGHGIHVAGTSDRGSSEPDRRGHDSADHSAKETSR